uniref:Knottin scorpion toxin-like domain-containing protein n=1 Tax=Oryza brachyantha TaxID=4533 RepID=J3MI23_ORYBR
MEEEGGCHIRSRTWKETRLCLSRGTCNDPCRSEGFDFGTCYPDTPLPSPSFVGRFFHVCYCSMNSCKTDPN